MITTATIIITLHNTDCCPCETGRLQALQSCCRLSNKSIILKSTSRRVDKAASPNNCFDKRPFTCSCCQAACMCDLMYPYTVLSDTVRLERATPQKGLATTCSKQTHSSSCDVPAHNHTLDAFTRCHNDTNHGCFSHVVWNIWIEVPLCLFWLIFESFYREPKKA